MLTATTREGKLVTLARMSKEAIAQVRQAESFYCPVCKNKVIIKAGDIITPHFAHLIEANCQEGKGGEGEYHYKGKLLLYEWFQQQQIDVKLEHYLPDIQQRPDLLIQVKNRQIAIEYQCAKVSPEVIYQRNLGYKRANIIPIWIIGANLFKRISTHHIQLNHFLTSFIHRFSATHPTSLFYFCPHQKQFSFIQDLIFTTNHQALAKQTFTSMHETTFYHLFLKRTFTNQEVFSLWKKELKKFRLRKRRNFGQEREWRNWLYSKNLHLDHVPTHIYLPVRAQYKMRVPLWIWQSRLLLEFLTDVSKGTPFTIIDLQRFLRRYTKGRVDEQLIHYSENPVREYIELLCQTGLLTKLNDTTFKQQEAVLYYKYIEEAMHGDTELLQCFMYNDGNG